MNAAYRSAFYPMHLALVGIGQNVLPVAWWTVASREPFRMLLAVDQENYSLGLLRELGEATLNFMPWPVRDRVVRAGYLSGRSTDKAEKLGLVLKSAATLSHSQLVGGAYSSFELVTHHELDAEDGDHALFLMDVTAVHVSQKPGLGAPTLYLGYRSYGTLGERWTFEFD